jgi:hypothetical protein
MQSQEVGTTTVVGNHALTADEIAAGAPPRPPFLGPEPSPGVPGQPIDPDSVQIFLLAPTGQQRAFSWPLPQEGDAGSVVRQEVGRFYVAWTPAPAEDGLWRWTLKADMATGQGQTDQGTFFVERPIVLAA